MPRSNAKKAPKPKVEEKVEEVEEKVEEVEEKEEVAEPAKKGRKPRKAAAEKAAPKKVAPKKAAKKTAESTAEEVTDSSAEPTKKTRHVPTRDSVEKEFDELLASVEEEIVRLRESTSKSKGVKFLRSVGKKIKTLRSHALRVTKQRKGTTRKNNTNSGFLKPVKISKELAKFTGWDQNEVKSRVDVTKNICQYIKDNNLQNPEDRRQIRVEDDQKLKKLLKYDAKKDDKPLTYYSLQTYLKQHFIKDEATPVVAAN